MTKILIVDDDHDIAEFLEIFLNSKDYETCTKHDGLEAINHLKCDDSYDLVITDIVMPNADGYDLIDFITEETNAKTIVISGGGTLISGECAMKAVAHRVDACLEKPLDLDKLLDTITTILA